MTLAGEAPPFATVAADMLRRTSGRDLTDDQVASVLDGFRELPVHPDVAPALRRLAEAGVPAYGFTHGSAEVAGAALEAGGVRDLFDRRHVVRGAEDVQAAAGGLPLGVRPDRDRARPHRPGRRPLVGRARRDLGRPARRVLRAPRGPDPRRRRPPARRRARRSTTSSRASSPSPTSRPPDPYVSELPGYSREDHSRRASPGDDGGGGQTGRPTTTITEVSVSTTTGPNRRTILCGLAAALAAPGALAACSSDAGEFQPGTPSATPAPAARPAGAARRWPRSRSAAGRSSRRASRPILLVQPTAGTVKGFDASCPHQGTTVDPPQDGVITCPNHFSQFDAATGALRKGPAATGLTEVPVRVVDGSCRCNGGRARAARPVVARDAASASGPRIPSCRCARTSRARRGARPHPFAVPAERLAAAWGTGGAATAGVAVLALPSDPDAPRDSDDLEREEPRDDAGGAPVLADWTRPGPRARRPARPRRSRPPAPARAPRWRRCGPSTPSPPTCRPGTGPARAGRGGRRARPRLAPRPPGPRPRRRGHPRRRPAPGVPVRARARRGPADRGRRRRGRPRRGRRRPRPRPDHGRAGAGVGPGLGARAGRRARAGRGRPRPPPCSPGLRRWAVVGAPHAGPARASFRLDEVVVDHLGHAVEDPEPVFRLTFALQSAQDPSLTVDAGTVWRDPTALRRWLDDPAELLLGELGRAARVYPEIGDALRTPRPTGMDLDLAGAHHFLAHVAADLDRAGFGVLLPAGWRGGPARLGLVGARAGRGPRGRRHHQRPAAPRRPRRLLLAPRGRRRGAVGRRDGRPRAREGAAGAPARALGRRRPRPPARRPRVPRRAPERRPPERRRRPAPRRHAPRRRPRAAARWRSCASTARSATSSRAGRSLEPLDDPPGVHATLRPYQRRGLSWLAFLARLGPRRRARRRHGPGQDAAGPGAGEPRARHGRRTRPDAARLPHLGGLHLAPGGRALRPRPARGRAPRRRAHRRPPRRAARRRPRRHLVRHAGPRLRGPRRASPGTASCSTRPRWSRTTARAARRPSAASTPSTASR